jgi:hypothetical protein
VSSIKYKVFREGIAMKINIKAGKIVQIVSISCPSMINLLKDLLIIIVDIIYKVKIVIKVKIIMAWS